jgi:hypothetical protein
MTQKERLEAEIKKKEEEIKALKEKMVEPDLKEILKRKSEFTDQEKFEVFEEVYKFSMSVIKDMKKNGYHNEDDSHYAFEMLMEFVAKDKDKFWKWFNDLGN